MWAAGLLYLGIGLFLLGWALLVLSNYLSDDNNPAQQIGLLMPHLAFWTLLLARTLRTSCRRIAGGADVDASARHRRTCQ